MPRHIAESVGQGPSWAPCVTRKVRSVEKLSNAKKFTNQRNGETKRIIATSDPVNDIKVSGKIDCIVSRTGLKTECTKGRICRELFVEPRGWFYGDIKSSWCSREMINESENKKTKRFSRWNKTVMHDNWVDLSDAAGRGIKKQNYEKQHSKLLKCRLDQPCQSSSHCAGALSSFTVSFRSAANYFLKKQSLGSFNGNVNGQVRLKTSKYVSETEDKTDTFSNSYPDDSSHCSRLIFSSSIGDSGESSFSNSSLKIDVKGINNKNVIYGEKDFISDKTSLRNPNRLQGTTLKLTSSVNAKSFNGGRIGKTGKGTAEMARLVKESGNYKPLLEPLRKAAFQNCNILLHNETAKKGEDRKTAYSVDPTGEGDGLKTLDDEGKRKGVQTSRSAELGLDVLLFAMSRFKNIVNRCSRAFLKERNKSEKEGVLKRSVSELETDHDNTTRLVVEVEDTSSLNIRPTTSKRPEVVERRINDKHLLELRRKVFSSTAPNPCFPSRNSRQHPPTILLKKADQAGFR